MRSPTMWYVRLAKAQSSLCAIRSEPLLVTWIFYDLSTDGTAFGASKIKGGCTGLSESTHGKMPHCWKSHVAAHRLQYILNQGIHKKEFFSHNWLCSSFILLPSAYSRWVVVRYKLNYVHKVLVNCLNKLVQEKSVVRWTDHLNMFIAVDWDLNQTKPKSTWWCIKKCLGFLRHSICMRCQDFRNFNFKPCEFVILSNVITKPTYWVCTQWRFRSDLAGAQSLLSAHWLART